MHGSWGRTGVRCRIKNGWEGSGREGDAIVYFSQDYRGAMTWVVVFWDDEDDPDNHKAEGLMFKFPGEKKWRDWEP